MKIDICLFNNICTTSFILEFIFFVSIVWAKLIFLALNNPIISSLGLRGRLYQPSNCFRSKLLRVGRLKSATERETPKLLGRNFRQSLLENGEKRKSHFPRRGAWVQSTAKDFILGAWNIKDVLHCNLLRFDSANISNLYILYAVPKYT